MKKFICSLTVSLLFSVWTYGQVLSLGEMNPPADFENIHVERIAGDELTSSFVIWVKTSVKEHYHAEHSEVVYILEGSGEMTIGTETQSIESGDYLFIPKGTKHSVLVTSSAPLKAISIQSPHFDGTDRVFTGQ